MQTEIALILTDVTKNLISYLEAVLPTISEKWWQNCVINVLSFQQKRRVEQKKITSLSAFDLAGLLRILDQNWYLISTKRNCSPEARHFVKEMQTIRNRWAHIGGEGFSDEDVYRDLDTLQRFAAVIESDKGIIEKIKQLKIELISTPATSASASSAVESLQGKALYLTEFAMGQIICLKSNPTVRGAVVGITPGEPENRYSVFIDGEIGTFYASQLQPEVKEHPDFQFLTLEELHSYLTALQIRHPSLSTLYSLNAARVDYIPYQFRPVLKFIHSDRPRLLIADAVGVGKTIEAGLILRELQARREIQSVLIICPRPLVIERKWQIEMKRFDERFIHLDGKMLRYCINETSLEGAWPEQYQKVIIPYSLFDESLLYGTSSRGAGKRRKGLLELDPSPRFDLVIVDEAHHIRNTETYAHRSVRFFCDNAEAVLFLTATPIQLGNDDLFVLLNVLRPDLIIDTESFEHMAAPNPGINRAIALARAKRSAWQRQALENLDEAASTSWGRAILEKNPEFQRISGLLGGEEISDENRIALISDLEQLHTFSGIINRTRRRDIGEFTVRKPETVIVEFTQDQRKLHDDLLKVQAEILTRLHGYENVAFMMTTIRRQGASCLYGLAPLLEEILMRRIDELAWEEVDSTQDTPDVSVIASIETQIRNILAQVNELDPYDPKLEALRRILHDKQKLANNKIMVFSSFRHTLSYLYQHLQADGLRVGVVHGGTPDEDRITLRNRFQLSRGNEQALDILLFSEVGCEGLDYQFCDCIVNYDLPWNPMRIEQRIGRIDRKGQQSETVAIYNLITPGTVDADIYDRCLVRIGVFNSALGGSEEMLGQITREIRNIAENFTLSDQERKEKLQQLADNNIRLLREQDELEEKQLELFGIRIPTEKTQKEIAQASSIWLTPDRIKNLVIHYLQTVCDKDQEYILGEKPLKTLRLSQDARNRMLQDYQQLSRQSSSTYREWENWLKGAVPHLPITFDADCAVQHPEAAFIMPLHPLVRQAAKAYDLRGRIATKVEVVDTTQEPGIYPFAVYQWQFHGIQEDMTLCPVTQEPNLNSCLTALLEKGRVLSVDSTEFLSPEEIDTLDSQHYKLWVDAREKHRTRTKEGVQYRRESLTTSHRARLSLLNEQLSQATDEKISRMRRSQIASAEADYARRIQELDIAIERADIIAQPVAFGILKIKGGTTNVE